TCALPISERIVTNDDLAKFVDTSDQWIVERTGIRQRHQVADDQPVSELAVAAARKALDAAGRTPAEVDLIIVATTTGDLTFPATATIVQRKLGCPVGVAFDVQAVCSGFVYALSVADGFTARGRSKCALVIGAEAMTRLMDWSDRAPASCSATGPARSCWSRGTARGPPPIAACWALRCAPTGPSRSCCSSTAGPPPQARSASCACRA